MTAPPDLRRTVAEVLGVDTELVTDDADLIELGLDSVRLMSLVDNWNAAGAEIDLVDLAQEPTLGAWRALLGSRPTVSRTPYHLVARTLQVRRVEQLTPRTVRVTLGGPELAGFVTGAPTDHVKVFFPEPGAVRPAMPQVVENRWTRPPGAQLRDYTVRHHQPDAGELDLDIVLHGTGVAAAWAAGARVGQWLGVLGPRGSVLVPRDLDWYVLVADETGLPALARWLEELPAGTRVIAVVEVADAAEELVLATDAALDLTWLHRTPERPDQLEKAVRALELPPGDGYVWVAGEAGAIRPLRARLRDERGLAPDRHEVDGYWKQGVADHDHHAD